METATGRPMEISDTKSANACAQSCVSARARPVSQTEVFNICILHLGDRESLEHRNTKHSRVKKRKNNFQIRKGSLVPVAQAGFFSFSATQHENIEKL